MNKAVFLDRDNTIIYDIPYSADIEKVKIMPDVPDVLREFLKKNYMLIIITNQSGVARGVFSLDEMHKLHRHLINIFEQENIKIHDIFYCPHSPEENCECRKPSPSLFYLAAEKHKIDLTESIMIGDKISDVESGINAGCKHNILLTDKEFKNREKHFMTAKNIKEALHLLQKQNY